MSEIHDDGSEREGSDSEYEDEVNLDCVSESSDDSIAVEIEEDETVAMAVLAGHIAVRGQQAHLYEPIVQQRANAVQREIEEEYQDIYEGRTENTDW